MHAHKLGHDIGAVACRRDRCVARLQVRLDHLDAERVVLRIQHTDAVESPLVGCLERRRFNRRRHGLRAATVVGVQQRAEVVVETVALALE